MRPLRRGGFNEAGNIAPLSVVVCLVLVCALGFVSNFGMAYALKSKQEQALDAARSACMDSAGAVPAKYADDPGLSLASTIARAVREQGIAVPLSVWFYEAPEQSVSASERLWIVGVQVEQNVELPFAAGSAVDHLTVASSRVIVAKPYASEVVWRPQQRVCGVYRFAEDAAYGSPSFSRITMIEAFPDEMVQAARSANRNETEQW